MSPTLVLATVIFAALLLGFGVQVYTPLAPDTVGARALYIGSDAPSHWYFATIDCIKAGKSLDPNTYVRNIFDMLDAEQDFVPAVDAEITTLGRTRRLIHDRPAHEALDPQCLKAGYFEMKGRSLFAELVGWR